MYEHSSLTPASDPHFFPADAEGLRCDGNIFVILKMSFKELSVILLFQTNMAPIAKF